MSTTAAHLPVSHRRIQDFAWIVPPILAFFVVVSAVGGLVSGVAGPDVIGADGLAGTFLAVP